MTIDELNEFKYLGKLIEYKKECLGNIRAAAGVKTLTYTGMPRGSGYHDRIAENIPAAVDLEKQIEKEIYELQERKDKIEKWIAQQPVKIKLIASLRFIEGLTWNEVADRVSLNFADPISDSRVRAYLCQYMKRQAKAEKKQRRNTNVNH